MRACSLTLMAWATHSSRTLDILHMRAARVPAYHHGITRWDSPFHADILIHQGHLLYLFSCYAYIPDFISLHIVDF